MGHVTVLCTNLNITEPTPLHLPFTQNVNLLVDHEEKEKEY